ncbi:PAS domain S-box protein [Gloeothece verrucosa]|uniref:Circadian input-output histidine kinase CikA n=1 Tax=Gloeothece verrucosa (strain PCC 7822) TaxID=497965 RepID=E0U662_GLOV7|nr:PAS domain S-box protein [Gloeothece verrucosa]ADN12398.1 PAS/PAC sensor hybrid histidine kinase [Gloeothece verrucosa PCC 7822]
MVRPKGNPHIARYHFTTDRDEPLTAKLSLRVTDSMLEEIKSTENWQEFIREAIAEKIKQKQETRKVKTEEKAAMLEAFPDLILTIDQQGKILDYSGTNSIEDYGLGCGTRSALPTQLQQKTLAEILPPQISEQWKQALAALNRRKNLVTIEYSLLINQIEEFYEARLVPLKESDNLLAIIRNISQWKRSEAALRLNERLYRAIGETIDYGIWICEPDGRNIYASDSFLNLVGMTQEQCSNFGWGEVLHPDDAEATIVAWQECSQSGNFWDREHRFRGIDGNWHPILARGVPVRDEKGELLWWAGINLDISSLKQTEAKLRESEAQLRNLADSAPVLIWMNNAEGGCEFVNKAYLKFFGESLEEIQGFGWSIHLHPDDAQPYLSAYEQAFNEQKPFRAQARIKRADGQYRWLDSRATPQFSSTGQFLGYIGSSSDISEIKEASEALRESEQRFKLLADNVPVLIWMDDEFQHRRFVNARYLQFAGISPEMLVQGWTDLLHPEDAQQYLLKYKQAIAHKSEYRAVVRLRRHDGVYRWFEVIGLPRFEGDSFVGYLGCKLDITERKQAEEALQQREQRFSNLFNGMEDWVLVYHLTEEDQPGKLIEVNEQASKKLGYSREELLSMSVKDIINPASVNPEASLKKLQSAKHIVVESVHITKEGQEIPVEVSATLFTLNGLPTVQAICRDITERKQIEQEREQLLIREQAAREAAESANRIKDEFLAVLSHELRSPLNPILGWAQMLKNYELDQPTTQKALCIIERNARLQAELIEDLLDVSRILRGKLNLNTTSVSLVVVIEAALETVRLAAQAKSIELRTQLETPVGRVLGDAARLQQVVWNLLSNAVKFTPSGGQVEIELEQIHGGVEIRVKDTGKGITPEFLPYIFDYFRQADSSTTRKFGGLGLGLAIARHLVELHGGKIWAESLGENQGATFIVNLPLLPQEFPNDTLMSVTPVSENKTPTLTLASLHILVVDDEADTREFLQFVLSDAGATVTVAASAKEALEIVTQYRFDLLVCDIGMPNINGYTLLRELRKWEALRGNAQIAAIALTAYAGELDRQQAFLAGFQRHITKPVEPQLLLKSIVDLIESNLG